MLALPKPSRTVVLRGPRAYRPHGATHRTYHAVLCDTWTVTNKNGDWYESASYEGVHYVFNPALHLERGRYYVVPRNGWIEFVRI